MHHKGAETLSFKIQHLYGEVVGYVPVKLLFYLVLAIVRQFFF